jgi:hypothetical protein
VIVGADNLKQLEQIIDVAESRPVIKLPDLNSEDEILINPAQWANL